MLVKEDRHHGHEQRDRRLNNIKPEFLLYGHGKETTMEVF